MAIVINDRGHEVDFETAVHYMDDEIREALHEELAPCTEQEFFDAYCVKHETKFGKEFIIN